MLTQPYIDALEKALGGVVARANAELGALRERMDAVVAAANARVAEAEAKLLGLDFRISDRLAQVKDGEPGRSVTLEDVAPLIEQAVASHVAALPPAEPGKSVTLDEVRPMLQAMVEALPPAEPGRSVTLEDVAPLIEQAVASHVAALPPAEPGKSVTLDEVRPMLQAMVEALPQAEPGPAGPEGRLPAVRNWEDRVYYEREVVSHDGATWQASKDTGHAPPHADWVCLARSGRDGIDGLSMEILGTFDPEKTDYKRLNVVSLNGGSFVARTDNPGPCPGEGWKLIASQGKTGRPGERGPVGGEGKRGPAGPAVVAVDISDQGMMTLVNGDGTTVEFDLYPLLSKLQG